MELDIERITKDALNEVVKRAVVAVIEEHSGWGVESVVKDSLREEAHRLCREDEEIRSLIREAVISWVRRQKGGN